MKLPCLPLPFVREVNNPIPLVLALLLCAFSAISSGQTTTTLAITSNGNPATTVASGSVVTLTATVSARSAPVTAGQVNFCDASAVYCTDIHLLGTAQLTGSGTAAASFIPGIGSHSYKAIFIGTKSAAASDSAAQPLTVAGPYPTTATIAASGPSGDYTLEATVVGNIWSAIGATGPTGTVSFLDTSQGNSVVATASLGAGTLSQSFALEVPYAVGNDSDSVAVGDFNGDGVCDLAVTNYSDNTVSVLLGKGDGTFQTQVTYATGKGPGSVAVADYNSDGVEDLALVNGTDNTISVFLGNGNGTFQAQLTSPVGGRPSSLAVGDFNGDGILDLAVVNYSDDTVSVLLGKGNGAFNTQVTYPTGSNPDSVAVGDFNGDGIPDLAVANSADDSISVLLGNGDGTFNTQVTYPTGGALSVAVGDFMGNGVLDLAVATGNHSLVVLLGKGDGTFNPATPYETDLSPDSVAVGDFNGDSVPDLVVVNTLGASSVLTGNGDGTFRPQVYDGAGGYASAVAVGDFNGDGLSDLAIAVYATSVCDPGCNLAAGNLSVLLNRLTETATATATGASATGTVTQSVEANYSGDSNYGASVSSTTGLIPQPPPQAQVAATLQFGAIRFGTTETLPLTITNIGGGTMTVAPSITALSYRITGSTCTVGLTVGQSCTLEVQFSPVNVATHDDTLTLQTNGATNPTVSLEGVGIGLTVSGAPLDFGTVIKGTSAVLTLTITDHGMPGTITVGGHSTGHSYVVLSAIITLTPPAIKRRIEVRFGLESDLPLGAYA